MRMWRAKCQEGATFLIMPAGKAKKNQAHIVFSRQLCASCRTILLVVEYKGADMDAPKVVEGRKMGRLWAELSNGLCKFIMVKDSNGSKS